MCRVSLACRYTTALIHTSLFCVVTAVRKTPKNPRIENRPTALEESESERERARTRTRSIHSSVSNT